MNEPVYILGASRTDFKRNLKKEGKTIRHIIIEAGKKALDDAKIDPAEIEAAAVGNFNAGQFTKQLHLGAFIPEIDEKLHHRCEGTILQCDDSNRSERSRQLNGQNC